LVSQGQCRQASETKGIARIIPARVARVEIIGDAGRLQRDLREVSSKLPALVFWMPIAAASVGDGWSRTRQATIQSDLLIEDGTLEAWQANGKKNTISGR
jgi:hypothetical protein